MRTLVRLTTSAATVAIVALWSRLATRGLPLAETGSSVGVAVGEAAPSAIVAVAVFSSLAVAAAVAAFRDAPLVLLLCGLISLLPTGAYTLVLPWPYPLIGVADLVLIGGGFLLWRLPLPGF